MLPIIRARNCNSDPSLAHRRRNNNTRPADDGGRACLTNNHVTHVTMSYNHVVHPSVSHVSRRCNRERILLLGLDKLVLEGAVYVGPGSCSSRTGGRLPADDRRPQWDHSKPPSRCRVDGTWDPHTATMTRFHRRRRDYTARTCRIIRSIGQSIRPPFIFGRR